MLLNHPASYPAGDTSLKSAQRKTANWVQWQSSSLMFRLPGLRNKMIFPIGLPSITFANRSVINRVHLSMHHYRAVRGHLGTFASPNVCHLLQGMVPSISRHIFHKAWSNISISFVNWCSNTSSSLEPKIQYIGLQTMMFTWLSNMLVWCRDAGKLTWARWRPKSTSLIALNCSQTY